MELNPQLSHRSITEVLRHCEEASDYMKPQQLLSAPGAEIVVVSDLHIAAGRKPDGTFYGTENFFADAAFLRFLRKTLGRLESHPAILVINGDWIDFLRVSEYPETEEALAEWRETLLPLGIDKTVDALRDSITKKEKEFGLKTNDYKAVWQLSMVAHGHPDVFVALAEWIEAGNKLVIVKGNHDLQFIWPAVRNFVRLNLAQRLASDEHSLANVLANVVGPNLIFVDDSLLIDDVFYLEHGHRYDKHAWPVGPAVLDNGEELNIPFGSFFNRYLLNRVELAYPFIDNVRPTVNVLPLLIRERFPLAMKLILYHIPFLFRIIPKRYFRYIFGRFLLIVAALGIPFLFAIIYLLATFPQFWGILKGIPTATWPGSGLAKSFAALTASYLLGRIVAYFQLAEPFSTAEPAREIFAREPRYRFIAMGHTHNPQQFNENGRWFYNTGTWIPIVETSSGELRKDCTYTFLHFKRDAAGSLLPTSLERWDDEAERFEFLPIVTRK
jgi:UDP-2,3-diacylglucosamine pyrophosphatase LpxH